MFSVGNIGSGIEFSLSSESKTFNDQLHLIKHKRKRKINSLTKLLCRIIISGALISTSGKIIENNLRQIENCATPFSSHTDQLYSDRIAVDVLQQRTIEKNHNTNHKTSTNLLMQFWNEVPYRA